MMGPDKQVQTQQSRASGAGNLMRYDNFCGPLEFLGVIGASLVVPRGVPRGSQGRPRGSQGRALGSQGHPWWSQGCDHGIPGIPGGSRYVPGIPGILVVGLFCNIVP